MQLLVTDVGRSADWYGAALGLEPFAEDAGIGYVALRHLVSGFVVVLTRAPDDRASGGPLDHLAFAISDEDQLREWADHLTAIGVEHQGVVPENGNPSLQLRDPDGTAIELVSRPKSHRTAEEA